MALDPRRTAAEDDALVSLLAKEDVIVADSYSKGIGVANDDKYGEDYAEYVASLGSVVQTIAQKNPNRTDVWSVLLRQPYNPDSEFVRWIATHSDKVTAMLLADAGGTDSFRRAQAIEVLGRILGYEQGQSTHKISPQQMRAINVIVRSALNDRDDGARAAAIQALSAMGSTSDINLLEDLAKDPKLGPTAR